MGYVPPPPPLIRLAAMYDTAARFLRRPDGFSPNLDRHGLPADYETYLWATYGAGRDLSPARRAYLYGSSVSDLIRRDLEGVLTPLFMAYDEV